MFPVLCLGGGAGSTEAALARDLLNANDDEKEHFPVLLSDGDRPLRGSRPYTATGLRTRCELDRGAYPKGQEVSDAQMAMLKLVPHRFHGDWNYTIHPLCRRK